MRKAERAIWKRRDAAAGNFIYPRLDEEPPQGGDFVVICLAHFVKRASQSADRLSNRVVWLNGTLAILGVLGLIVAAHGVFCK